MFENNRAHVAKFRDTISSAIELTWNIAFDGAHTPRECFLWVVTIMSCYAPDKEWKLEGWGVGEDGIERLSRRTR